jgi:predicted RNA-binding Zn-ribbon protein involved in translation (DUF1610 family)/DNA polymerase elongation subunit (family B)
MCGPKILLLDIETSPHLGYFWGLFKQNIAPSQIIEPSSVMCYAAKWLGEDEVTFKDWSEKDFIQTIYDMIGEADGIVHYNGKAFDMKHLNREFLLAGLGPPSPYTNIDLLSTFRTNFKFASNKLEYTSLQLGYDGKVQNRGMQLWIDCMAGDLKAWEEMKAYNIQDTVLLEGMHNDLLPWIKGYPNHALFGNSGDRYVCVHCGSEQVQRRGKQRTLVRVYARYHCQDCGKWQRDRLYDKHLNPNDPLRG